MTDFTKQIQHTHTPLFTLFFLYIYISESQEEAQLRPCQSSHCLRGAQPPSHLASPCHKRSTWSVDGGRRRNAGDKPSLRKAQGVRGREKHSGLAAKCTFNSSSVIQCFDAGENTVPGKKTTAAAPGMKDNAEIM